jgi:hypothetical protein
MKPLPDVEKNPVLVAETPAPDTEILYNQR